MGGGFVTRTETALLGRWALGVGGLEFAALWHTADLSAAVSIAVAKDWPAVVLAFLQHGAHVNARWKGYTLLAQYRLAASKRTASAVDVCEISGNVMY